MDEARANAAEPLEAALLFAYGTLGPAQPDLPGWFPDRVRGRLFDLGTYPVLVDWDDSAAGWVQGHVRAVEPAELIEQLDPYEGVGEGLFQRRQLTTEAGRRVWVYVYPHAVPPSARGPLAEWCGRRIDPELMMAPGPEPEA